VASKRDSVTGFIMRRGLTPSEIEEWNDLVEAWDGEIRKLQGCLTSSELRIALGGAPAEGDFAYVEALLDSLDAIEAGQARYAVSFNQSVGRRRRAWVAGELDRLRGRAAALQPNPAATGHTPEPRPVEKGDLETRQQRLHGDVDLLESQLGRVDATTIEPARSRLLAEAVLTGRSVVKRWNALKEHLPRTVDDRTTQRVNSLMTRLLRLPGAPPDPGVRTTRPVILQVHPERHLDGVEEVKAAHGRHLKALESLTSANGWTDACLHPNGAQMLVDEALHRLEIERISQVRDSWSLVKRTEPSDLSTLKRSMFNS
jgi:hypothetical protein